MSTGYNGFPIDVPDYKEWYEDRETKYKYIVAYRKWVSIYKKIYCLNVHSYRFFPRDSFILFLTSK